MAQSDDPLRMPEEEMAAFQEHSNNYEPEVAGPRIGQKQSTKAIMDEFSQADLVYRKKTQNMSPRFPDSRNVKGDGNCGWSAISFGYFETLLRSQNPSKFAVEEERLKSLTSLLQAAGLPEFVYEDWVNATISLLRDTAASLPCMDDGAALLARFNDEETSSQIIQHFRSVTSAWMKSNPEDYADFLENQTVEQYCAAHIDPYAAEIDQVGLNALINAIIKPAGMAVEILYLDRSKGDVVNRHRFEPDSVDGKPPNHDVPTIYLLYRLPGHYDLLYKHGDDAESTNLAPQVNLLTYQPSIAGEEYPSIPIVHQPDGLKPPDFGSIDFMSGPLGNVPGITLNMSTAVGVSNISYDVTGIRTISPAMPAHPAQTLPVREQDSNFRHSIHQRELSATFVPVEQHPSGFKPLRE